jgi:hypothetical protein
LYAFNNSASKYSKKNLVVLKGEINTATAIDNVSIPLVSDRTKHIKNMCRRFEQNY